MRWSHVFHLGVKELRGLVRDPMMLALIVYVFTFAIYAAATAIPETLTKAPIAIVDEDQSALSKRITDAFYPPYFRRPTLITRAEMDKRMDEGLETFALDIPPDFQRDVLAGRRPALQLNVDATRMSQAFNGTVYVETIVAEEIQAFVERNRAAATLPVDLVLRARFNPELNKSWLSAVMELVNQVTMLAMVLTGASLIREREHGTVEHLLVMPVTPLEIMVGKVWSMGAVVLVAASLSLASVVEGLLLIPLQGSMPLFLAGMALHLFAVTAMGIFLGTVARSMPQFGLLLILILLPLQMLSGGTTPRESMPEFVQLLMLAAPTTQFVILSQSILFRGAGFSIVWPQFLALAVIASALIAFSLARFRKSLAAMG